VHVECDIAVFSSERVIYRGGFNEVMGSPPGTFNTTQWFPWYDNQGMASTMLIGNPSESQNANCTISVAGIPRSTDTILAGRSVRRTYNSLIGGPVKVDCNIPVFSSQRATYGNSFNEVMGTPPAGLSTSQWFPWYDNIDLTTWVLIGNPSSSQTANCTVSVAGIQRSTHVIPAGDRVTPTYAGLQDGPVKVQCDIPVFSSERSLYLGSFNEVMGTPPSAFNQAHWFPWYDSIDLMTWVLIGNPSATQSANCSVAVAGQVRSSHVIPPGQRVTPGYLALRDGPVKVECDIPVFASERSIFGSSFNEVMGVQPQ
jgi:hypothetical protein